MNSIRGALFWKNAWRVRSIALGCIVLFVGIGSQVLVNAFAANTDVMTFKVTAYTIQGKMADGSWTHLGACAVDRSEFPFGTVIALYNTDGTFNRQCTAEDTGGTIGYGDLDLAMPLGMWLGQATGVCATFQHTCSVGAGAMAGCRSLRPVLLLCILSIFSSRYLVVSGHKAGESGDTVPHSLLHTREIASPAPLDILRLLTTQAGIEGKRVMSQRRQLSQ